MLLDGITVLDLTRLLPGPYATLILAELGATVVKIEHPRGGDPARRMAPLAGGTGAYFHLLNRGKRSVTLDLAAPEAREALDALLARADVCLEGFRPDAARRLGVDGASVTGRHPRIVHASISGFGQDGPYAARPGHDLTYSALAGLLAVDGDADAPPRVPRLLVVDGSAAYQAAIGILAALVARGRTGRGSRIDVSMHEAALAWQRFTTPAAFIPDAEGELAIAGQYACYNVYQCADGAWLALGALETKFWAAFCAAVERPDWVARQFEAGEAQRALLDETRALVGSRPRGAWLARFAGPEICLAPVLSVQEALVDPHVRARGLVVDDGRERVLRSAIGVAPGGESAFVRPHAIRPAPVLGADTDDVLGGAGLAPARIAALRRAGVV